MDQPPKSCTIGGGEFFSDAGFKKEGNKWFLRVGIGGLGPGSVDEAVLIDGLRGSQVEVLNLVVFYCKFFFRCLLLLDPAARIGFEFEHFTACILCIYIYMHLILTNFLVFFLEIGYTKFQDQEKVV